MHWWAYLTGYKRAIRVPRFGWLEFEPLLFLRNYCVHSKQLAMLVSDWLGMAPFVLRVCANWLLCRHVCVSSQLTWVWSQTVHIDSTIDNALLIFFLLCILSKEPYLNPQKKPHHCHKILALSHWTNAKPWIFYFILDMPLLATSHRRSLSFRRNGS